MKIRPYRETDLEAVTRIWEKHHSASFSLPALNPSLVAAVVEDGDGTVVAFGNLKLYAEAVLVMDHDRPKTMLGRALKMFFGLGVATALKFNISEIHAVSQDPDYADILRTHFEFSDVLGEHLVREVN